MCFSYNISQLPGNKLIIADALSRSPTQNTPDPAWRPSTCISRNRCLCTSRHTRSCMTTFYMYIKKQMPLYKQSLPATGNRIKQIRDCQQKDETCKLISIYCLSSSMARQKSQHQVLWNYTYHFAAKFSDEDGLFMRGDRIISHYNKRYWQRSIQHTKESPNAKTGVDSKYGGQDCQLT